MRDTHDEPASGWPIGQDTRFPEEHYADTAFCQSDAGIQVEATNCPIVHYPHDSKDFLVSPHSETCWTCWEAAAPPPISLEGVSSSHSYPQQDPWQPLVMHNSETHSSEVQHSYPLDMPVSSSHWYQTQDPWQPPVTHNPETQLSAVQLSHPLHLTDPRSGAAIYAQSTADTLCPPAHEHVDTFTPGRSLATASSGGADRSYLQAMCLEESQQRHVPTATTDASQHGGEKKKEPRRTPLSHKAVMEIFAERPQRTEHERTFPVSTRHIKELAKRFCVQDRTVRDIWNRRSWVDVTRPAWTLEEIASDPNERASLDEKTLAEVIPAQTRKRGRPAGARDYEKRPQRKVPKDG